MTKAIQQYEPQLLIELKCGRKLITAKKHEEAILRDIDSKRFIRIEGVTVNVLEIKTIEAMGGEYDILMGLTEDQRNKALTRFKQYELNTGNKPSTEWRSKWIQTNILKT